MHPPAQSLGQKLVEKLSNSRDFSISLILHVILIAVFGATVLFPALREPSDFEGEPGTFLSGDPSPPALPPQLQTAVPQAPNVSALPTSAPIHVISTPSLSAPSFTLPDISVVRILAPMPDAGSMAQTKPPVSNPHAFTSAQAADIQQFTEKWTEKGRGKGVGDRSREFVFSAFIGQYAGGNWNSTVQVANSTIENGSLPNLLYFMSHSAKNKVTTNYKSVKAVKLDSDELFSEKIPFIFLTGTRDFTLSDNEVANLQKYVKRGGAIWGDSSVPGRHSRFDIAFRREMKRVLPDIDKDWEALPASHPIYAQAYFPEVKEAPSGLNFYKEPIYALKIYGEVAIIYTANDYGDMWQVGLDAKGQVDMGRNEKHALVAMNEAIWHNRDTYLRNITPESLALTYKFGTNVVIHLLTRWEGKTSSTL